MAVRHFPVLASQHGTLNIDIQSLMNSFRPSATSTITADQNGATYGSSTNYVTVYSDTDSPSNTQGLKLQNVTGYGILLVKGDLNIPLEISSRGANLHGLCFGVFLVFSCSLRFFSSVFALYATIST
jgi:hypothetical protein